MNDYVKSDLMRYYGKYDFITFIKAYFKNRSFRLQYAIRLSQSKGFSKLWGIFLYKINRTKKNIQIPRQTKIGYGLSNVNTFETLNCSFIVSLPVIVLKQIYLIVFVLFGMLP